MYILILRKCGKLKYLIWTAQRISWPYYLLCHDLRQAREVKEAPSNSGYVQPPVVPVEWIQHNVIHIHTMFAYILYINKWISISTNKKSEDQVFRDDLQLCEWNDIINAYNIRIMYVKHLLFNGALIMIFRTISSSLWFYYFIDKLEHYIVCFLVKF